MIMANLVTGLHDHPGLLYVAATLLPLLSFVLLLLVHGFRAGLRPVRDCALGGRTHAAPSGRNPKGGTRPVTRLMSSATYCRLKIPSPTGMQA